ncbi:MAG TPA: competence/damage-inducible protein A [Terriglobales bacterium]|nr:competence/damage-inducible protein A [Terriglobales bacterium]
MANAACLVTLLPVNAEIIAVGSEMLTPYRQDTNSLYLTDQLNQLGVEVVFKTVVGDGLDLITSAARAALGRADIIVFTGGLGPTEDDLTREGVAAALGREVRRDADVLTALYKRFAELRRSMPENNARQADVVVGATVLPNPNGTAPGQWIETTYEGAERMIALLPGPPWEMKPLFEAQCLPRLRSKLPPAHIATRTLKVAMMGESQCDLRIAPIYKQYADVQTTILAGPGDIEIHLRARADEEEAAQKRVDRVAGEIEDELEDFVYSSQGESLEQIVGYYLQMRNTTVAVAESCTGGLLGARISSIAGSSRYFLGGVISYSNDLKTLFANVPPLMIQAHGAVSREVAAAMAEGIREECNAGIGVAVTGIAGPGGGSEEKPVGLVYHALHDGVSTEVVERKFPGDRERIRMWAAQQALDLIRRKLM